MFDENGLGGTDVGGGMGAPLTDVGTLSVGTNTVQGTLDASTDISETDPFMFTVAAGTQVDFITLEFSNPMFFGEDPGAAGSETGGDAAFNYQVIVSGTMGGMGVTIDSAIGSTGVPNAMGSTTDCATGAMGAGNCTLFSDGVATDLANGVLPPAMGEMGMGTPLVLDFAANPANPGTTLDFPLQAADYNFLNSVVALTGMTDGIESVGALVSFDWIVTLGVSDVNPVPLPAAAWLFVSALAGLFGFRKYASNEA